MMINRVLMVFVSVAFAGATGELLCSEELFNGLGGVLPNPKSSSEYIKCVEGVVQIFTCPNGQFFDAQARRCLFETVAQGHLTEVPLQFEELCNNPNIVEIFPNPTNCSQYIICYGSVPIEQSCSDGLLFNPQLNVCDIPSNVICGYSCPAVDDPYNPVWLPDSRLEDCSRHYLCFQGNPLQFYCYNNLYFDIVSRTCTYPQYSACSVPGVYCNGNMTMNIANPRSCASYYVCVDGFPHFRNCDYGEYFSEELGVCIPGMCNPGTTTTSGSTTNEPTSTTVSSGTTPSLTSTTDVNTPTTDFTSTTLSTSPTTLETTTEIVTGSTGIESSTFSSTPESTTWETSTPEFTTTTLDVSGTSAASPTTLEATTEFGTGSTGTESTSSSTPESTTWETSTPELTTTTLDVSSTSAASPTTLETTTEFVTGSTGTESSTSSSTPESTTWEPTIPELTTTTLDVSSTSTASPTTLEPTTEFVTGSPGTESSTSSTTSESTTWEPTTPELTTTTMDVSSTSTPSPTTLEATTEFGTGSPGTESSTSSTTSESTTWEPTTSELTTTGEITPESSSSTSTETTTIELTTTTTTEMVTIDPNEICAENNQGFRPLPHPTICYKYVLCINESGIESTCATGQIFNPATGTCVPGNQETCTLT
uniref:Chitin-binding type-2 domain-containing protein n=1 Tax=Anopheles culicifacies TaxID=139723 RepID=A0A182MUZ6_9DIPT